MLSPCLRVYGPIADGQLFTTVLHTHTQLSTTLFRLARSDWSLKFHGCPELCPAETKDCVCYLVLRPSANHNQIIGSKKYDLLDRCTRADPLRSLQMEHGC